MPVYRRTKSKRIGKTNRITLNISISVKRRTVDYRTCQNVLIYKAFDFGVVVPRTHIVQTVFVGRYAIFTIVQKYYTHLFSEINSSYGTYSKLSLIFPSRLVTAYVVEMIVQNFVVIFLRNKSDTVNEICDFTVCRCRQNSCKRTCTVNYIFCLNAIYSLADTIIFHIISVGCSSCWDESVSAVILEICHLLLSDM